VIRVYSVTIAVALAVTLLLFAQRRAPETSPERFRGVVDLTAPIPADAAQQMMATRLEAPALYIPGAWSVDQIPPERLIGSLIVLDVRQKAQHDPQYRVSPADISDFERAHGLIPPGSIVVARTGGAHDQHAAFPAFSYDAVQFLTEGRNTLALGTDSAAIAGDASTLRYAGQHQLYGLTGIRDLDRAPQAGAILIVAPPRALSATQADARILALLR